MSPRGREVIYAEDHSAYNHETSCLFSASRPAGCLHGADTHSGGSGGFHDVYSYISHICYDSDGCDSTDRHARACATHDYDIRADTGCYADATSNADAGGTVGDTSASHGHLSRSARRDDRVACTGCQTHSHHCKSDGGEGRVDRGRR